jgi:predicted RNase H-like nuclease (RuvC/YqgF family)
LKPLIIGIDPGTTVGLAFLDIYGKPIEIESGKGLSVNDIVWEIRQHGKPIVIACDRKIAPTVVKKIRSIFKCRIHSEFLTRSDKKKLIRRFAVRNNHEADALASALKAYNVLSPKLRQIKRQEKEMFEERIGRRLLGKT